MYTPISKIIGGILIVASSLVGAGILALPASLGVSGFYPSVIGLVFGYLFMLYAILLLLEINLWFPEKSNLIIMCRDMLGSTAKNIVWVCYLLLLYALLVAYIVGITPLIQNALLHFSIAIPSNSIGITFVIVMGIFIYYGTRSVDYVNRILTISLLTLFFLLMLILTPYGQSELLAENNMRFIWVSAPIIVTAFLVHFVVPSLRDYLHSDTKALGWVFAIGLFLAFLLYSLWIFSINGVVNFEGLVTIANSDTPTASLVYLLEINSNNLWIGKIAAFFSAIAIVTSFLGVSLGLAHFITDGLHTEIKMKNRYLVIVATFFPPILIAIFFPESFINVLRYAGILTVVIFIVFPILMIWKGRYLEKRTSQFRVYGGKLALIIIFIIAIGILYTEIADTFSLLPSVT